MWANPVKLQISTKKVKFVSSTSISLVNSLKTVPICIIICMHTNMGYSAYKCVCVCVCVN